MSHEIKKNSTSYTSLDLSNLWFKSDQKFDLNLKSNTSGLSLNPEFGLAANTPDNNNIINSGASEHYLSNTNWLINYKANNKSIITGIGDILILANHRELIITTKVSYIPEIKTILLSSCELAKNKRLKSLV